MKPRRLAEARNAPYKWKYDVAKVNRSPMKTLLR